LIDHVYVINLLRRSDRRDIISNELNSLGINYSFSKNTVDGEYLTVNELISTNTIEKYFIDPSGICTMGVYGCALSHYNTWTEFLKTDYNTALILEDDVYFHPSENVNKLYDILTTELPLVKNWDIFFLARQSIINEGTSITENIIEPITSWNLSDPKPWGAHSYIVTRKAAEYLVKNYLPIKYAVDVYLESFLITKKLNVISLKMSYFFQRNAYEVMRKNYIINEALKANGLKNDFDSDIVSNEKLSDLQNIYRRVNYPVICMKNYVITFLDTALFDEIINSDKLSKLEIEI